MKEEQFMRQVTKLETQNKSDAKRLQDKYQLMINSRSRENDRAL